MLSFNYSGVVQLVARQPLELVILVRVQAPEPLKPDSHRSYGGKSPEMLIFPRVSQGLQAAERGVLRLGRSFFAR